MKNQYFGDLNDYRKYGLLRTLCLNGTIRILICWMLTPDDGTSDGRFTDYLGKPRRWRSYDPALYDSLQASLVGNQQRRVGVVEQENLVPSASYFSLLLRDDNREEYFDLLREESAGSTLIFFDPDNGMEVKSVPPGHRGSHKYLCWKEASSFFASGHSLLIYQHFPREKRESYITLLSQDFNSRMGATKLFSLQTSSVVYFLLPHPLHDEVLAGAIDSIKNVWGKEFTIRQHST